MSDTKDDKDESAVHKSMEALLGRGFTETPFEHTADTSSASQPSDSVSVQPPVVKAQAQSMAKSEPQPVVGEPVQQSPQDTVTKTVKKTIQDIEQDIAKGDFDLSDVRAFGDHDTPEVDTIDISQDAQSVLDKVQKHMDTAQQSVTENDQTEQKSPAQSPDVSASDFVTENADKFKQAVQNQATHPQTPLVPESAKDTANLSFDFDIEHIQVSQSPVKRSLLAIVFNFTVFMILLVAGFGGAYYVYMEKVQVQTNAPMVLKAPQDIKVKPMTQTGMKIENLDKDVYNIIGDKQDLENKVLRLRPLPEQPLQLPTADTLSVLSESKVPDTDMVKETIGQPAQESKKTTVTIVKTEKTISKQGVQVEKLTMATPNTVQSKSDEAQQITESQSLPKIRESDNSELNKPVITEKLTELKGQTEQSHTLSTSKTDAKKSVTPTQITKADTPKVSKAQSKAQSISPAPLPETVDNKKTAQKIDLPFTVSDATDRQNLGWRVQLAALTNMKDAQETYASMQKKYTFLQHIPFHVEKAMVKQKMYYRLQAIHLADKASAIALCGQIKKAQGNCIVKK